MKGKLLYIICMMVLAVASGALAQVSVTYNAYYATISDTGVITYTSTPVTNVNNIGIICSDYGCTSSAGNLRGGAVTSSGGTNSLTVTYPTTLASTGYYGDYFYANGYIPWEVLSNFAGTGTAGPYNVYLSRLENCNAPIRNLTVTNDVQPNIPLTIGVSASIDSTTYAAIAAYGPLQFTPPSLISHYSVTTNITIRVYNASNHLVNEQTQVVSIPYSGNASTSFTWTPTDGGDHTVIATSDVNDQKCIATHLETSTKMFHVLTGNPRNMCYTLMNGLTTTPQFPNVGDTVTISGNKISNYADNNYALTSVPTDLYATIKHQGNGTVAGTGTLAVGANIDTVNPAPFSFSWNTGTYAVGWYDINISGIANSALCSGLNNTMESLMTSIYLAEVPNNPPVWTTNIGDITLNEDFGTYTYISDLSLYVGDTDGDTITFSIVQENTSEVDCEINGNQLILHSVSEFNGQATCTVRADDGNTGTADNSFTITVNPVNDVPAWTTPISDVTVNEDFGTFTHVTDLSTLVTDIDGDTVTFSVVLENPLQVDCNIVGNQLILSSALNYNGLASCTVRANDGNGGIVDDTFTITVSSVNDAPVAQSQSVVTNEDVPLTITLVATDVESDPLTYNIVTQPANGILSGSGASITYTPNPNYYGTDSFTFNANDGNLDSNNATVTITVNPVSDAPVVNITHPNPGSNMFVVKESVSVVVSATDADNDPLTYVLDFGDGQIVSGTVAGAINLTHQYQSVGNYTIAVNVTDGTSIVTDSEDIQVYPYTFNVTSLFPYNDSAFSQIDYIYYRNEALYVSFDVTDKDTGALMPNNLNSVYFYSVTQPSQVVNLIPYDNGATIINGQPAVPNGTYYYYVSNIPLYDELLGTNVVFVFTYNNTDAGQEQTAIQVLNNPLQLSDIPDITINGTYYDDSVDLDTYVSDLETPDNEITWTVSGNTNVQVSIDANNIVNFSVIPGWTGTETITFTADDNDGSLASDTVIVLAVNTSLPNNAPVALDDSFTVNMNSNNVLNVLANDTDLDGDTLSVQSVTAASNGVVTNNGNSISYAPNAGYCGSDTFTYTVTDGNSGIDTATVTLTISCVPVNTAPVAFDDSYRVIQNSVANIFTVLANDTDADGDTLSVQSVTSASNGAVTNNGNSVSYTSASGFCGIDSFTYTVTDGNSGTDTATVSVNVSCGPNNSPVTSDDTFNVSQNSIGNVLDVLANDFDPDGDTLTVSSVTPVSNGALTNNGNSVSYTPVFGFCGTDYFNYTASDGNGGSSTAFVTINVVCLNNTAPVAFDDSYVVSEDSVNSVFTVLANDTDADGDTLSVQSVTSASNGAVTNNGNSVSYTPNTNYCGSDSFSYTVSDGNGGTDSATVTVSITCINDAPVTSDDTFNVSQNSIGNVLDVLANDFDPDGDTLTVSSVTPVSNGALTNNGNSVSYTPVAGFCGTDYFNYTASDGNGGSSTAFVTINVVCLNNTAPVAFDDSYVVSEDSVNSVFTVLANDTDVDGDTLSVQSVTSASNGAVTNNSNSVSYTPNTNYCGSDSFSYTISDGNGGTDSATVFVTVTCTPDIPIAYDVNVNTAEDTPIIITLNCVDPDGDALTYVPVTNPGNGNLSPVTGNQVTYSPALDYNGIDSFTYKCNDGSSDSNTATVSITVGSVSDAPVITTVPQTTTLVNNPYAYDVDATDADGDTLTYYLVVSPVGMTINPVTGLITWTPGVIGSFNVSLAVGDGTTNATQSYILVVQSDTTPSVRIDANPVAGEAPLLVEFDAVVSGNAPFTYEWDFNSDGVTDSTQKSPDYTFTLSGNYLVSLKVTDNDGDIGYDTQMIRVEQMRTKESRNALSVQRISLSGYDDDYVHAGEDLHLAVNVGNDGYYDLKEVSVTAVIPELGVRRKVGPFRLYDGEEVVRNIVLEIPEYAEPGVYTVRLTIGNDYYKRIKHRPVFVIE